MSLETKIDGRSSDLGHDGLYIHLLEEYRMLLCSCPPRLTPWWSCSYQAGQDIPPSLSVNRHHLGLSQNSLIMRITSPHVCVCVSACLSVVVCMMFKYSPMFTLCVKEATAARWLFTFIKDTASYSPCITALRHDENEVLPQDTTHLIQKTMLPTKKSVPRSSKQSDHT